MAAKITRDRAMISLATASSKEELSTDVPVASRYPGVQCKPPETEAQRANIERINSLFHINLLNIQRIPTDPVIYLLVSADDAQPCSIHDLAKQDRWSAAVGQLLGQFPRHFDRDAWLGLRDLLIKCAETFDVD